jgi:hypothetical protein
MLMAGFVRIATTVRYLGGVAGAPGTPLQQIEASRYLRDIMCFYCISATLGIGIDT